MAKDRKDTAALRQPALQDARALAMVESRIHGRTLAQIAEEFNVSTDTVSRSLSRAEKMNLTERYEDFIYGRLGALALGAYEHALQENDTAVATKVLESIGLIRKPKDLAQDPGDGGDTWEAYLKVRRSNKGEGKDGYAASPQAADSTGGPGTRGGDSAPPLETLDGEIAGEVGQAGE